MDIKVKGFMRVREAAISVSPIALIGGGNEAGKTSLCRAIAAAACGLAVPVVEMVGGKLTALVKKGDIGQLVCASDVAGSVTISAKSGTSSMTWPAGEYATTGVPVTCSPLSAGLLAIPELAAESRVAVLTDLVGASPSRGDLAQALTDAGLDPNADVASVLPVSPAENDADGSPKAETLLDYLFARIEVDGWDLVDRSIGEFRAQLKGEWSAITGERWGDKKALAWAPPNWRESLSTRSLDELDAKLAKARVAVDNAKQARGLGAARLADDVALAGQVDRLAADLAERQAASAGLSADLAAARQARQAIPEVAGDSGLPCPHCGKHVRPEKDHEGFLRLIKTDVGKAKSRDEHAECHKRIVAADGAIAKCSAALNAANQDIGRVMGELERAKAAAARVAAAGPESARTEAINLVAAAQEALDDATADRAALAQRLKVDRILASLKMIAAVLDVTGKTGLRERVASAKLAETNARLAKVCADAGWPVVTIASDMSIRYDRWSYAVISKSARYRVNATLQLAFAKPGDLLLFDGIDILDMGGRNGLLAAINATGNPAVITMTCNTPATLPDLDAAGIGRSYWIEDGILSPRNVAAAPAKAA